MHPPSSASNFRQNTVPRGQLPPSVAKRKRGPAPPPPAPVSLVPRLFHWLRCPRKHSRQRLHLLLAQLRMRQWLARQHLGPPRGVVDEDCLDHRRLLQIARLQPLVDILIRVVRPALVIKLVLNELESRNPHRVKR